MSKSESESRERELVRCLRSHDAVFQEKRRLHSLIERARGSLLSCKFSGGSSSLFAAHRYGQGAKALQEEEYGEGSRGNGVAVKLTMAESTGDDGESETTEFRLVRKEAEESRARNEQLLKFFAGLPSPALRDAQERFGAVVQAAVDVANAQLAATRLREEYVEKYQTMGEEDAGQEAKGADAAASPSDDLANSGEKQKIEEHAPESSDHGESSESTQTCL